MSHVSRQKEIGCETRDARREGGAYAWCSGDVSLSPDGEDAAATPPDGETPSLP
ncbi:MAG: hypothetical protein IKX30_06185 [Victivallales bacterium]|nr:hypothetical protein [Victivallales bacterium]